MKNGNRRIRRIRKTTKKSNIKMRRGNEEKRGDGKIIESKEGSKRRGMRTDEERNRGTEKARN